MEGYNEINKITFPPVNFVKPIAIPEEEQERRKPTPPLFEPPLTPE